jgi:hypothetical protein
MHQPRHDCYSRLRPIRRLDCARLLLRKSPWVNFLGFANEKGREGCAHNSYESRNLVSVAHSMAALYPNMKLARALLPSSASSTSLV